MRRGGGLASSASSRDWERLADRWDALVLLFDRVVLSARPDDIEEVEEFVGAVGGLVVRALEERRGLIASIELGVTLWA